VANIRLTIVSGTFSKVMDKAIVGWSTFIDKGYHIKIRGRGMKHICKGIRFLTSLFFTLILMIGPISTANSKQAHMPDDARSIPKKAFVFGFPIVMNYKTMFSYAIDKSNPDYKGPFNQVACEARLFTPDDKAVVTPNADTPYCMYWMDVRAEPVVLSAPDMEPERFYHFQLIDLYTHNFAYIGTLTTGNKAGAFLIAGPDWNGEAPEGITDVFRSESGLVFNVVRTQLFGPDDLENVKEIQAGYRLQPLSEYTKTEAPSAKPMPELPVWDEGAQFDGRFFDYLDLMMGFLEKPAKGDEALWADLARLGIGTDGTFDFDALPAETQKALEAGVKEGLAEIEAFVAKNSSDPQMSAKLFGTRTFLEESAKKNFQLDRVDLLRSAAAHTGLYGNSGAEAIYPTYLTDAEGKPLDASANSYTLTFKEDELPPVKSFWSLTMYDGKTQLFIENPLERYVLNSTMAEQFKRAEDGSLVLYISKDSPGTELEPNWLPAPDGPFYTVMRLYGPEKEALAGGSWSPPPLVNASSSQKSAATLELSAKEIDTLVRRTYPYVAMFNVINKGAMMEENPTRTGWNGTFAATGLLDHTSKAIARPNNDTLYITTIMDLRGEPVIVSYPAFDSMYVSLEISAYDHYVDIPLTTTKGDFEKPVKVLYYTQRTQGYGGEAVEGVDRIIEMTGDFAIAFLRVMPHAAEPERLEKNLAAMKLVKAVGLSEYLGQPAKPVAAPDFPDYSTDEGIYEKNFLEVMQFVIKHTTFDPDDELDAGVLAALKPLGVEPGKTFDRAKVPHIDGKALAAAAKRIHGEAIKIWTDPKGNPYVNDLFLPKGEMDLDPMVVQSAYGPIGLPAHQAVYPGIGSAGGKPLNAQHDYVIRMLKEQMPPSMAFWSVTLYDAKNGFFIPNDHKKYSVGENAGYKLDDQGGIEIHVAAEQPEGVPEENWLPINRKDEALDIVMRIYAPDVEKMKTWTPPKAELVK
jgi:hypothetical protein